MIGASPPIALEEVAARILATADARAKAMASHIAADLWRRRELAPSVHSLDVPRPARPPRPELKAPRDMPRRRKAGTRASRIALLHALAHIELNAIDLAWDLIARFGDRDLPHGF